METKTLELSYQKLNNTDDGIPVIIVAAGSSRRMGGVDKRFISLSGIPVIVRTMQRFENCEKISRIILVTKEEDILEMQNLAHRYMITKLTDIVTGGCDRQSSVLRGIERLSPSEEKVLIHDGARPFTSNKIICDCVLNLNVYDAVVCAVKINDTVKLANDQGEVQKTLDRNFLYSAQTPQGVNVSLYKKALGETDDLSKFTDDASIMENRGYKVKIIDGSPKNIKITTKEDILLAQAIIKGEEYCE